MAATSVTNIFRLDAGGVEQLPQHRCVAFQRGPSAAGERDRGPRGDAAAVPVRGHVPGVFELAQVGDQVARCQPDQVLQLGEGQVVTVVQGRQRHRDAQPGGGVDQRVQAVLAHARRSLGSMTAISRYARPAPNALTPQTPAGPA